MGLGVDENEECFLPSVNLICRIIQNLSLRFKEMSTGIRFKHHIKVKC